jgi:hypothetical protein
MSRETLEINNYCVNVEVHHFRPSVPVRWGATPEDSDEGEEYQLNFDVIDLVKTGEGVATEIPTFDDIEEALVNKLH